MQTEDYTQAGELFNSDYAYFSSTSSGWLAHAAHYSENIIDKLQLTKDSYVVEIACNDGYLLKNFVTAGIPCLGIEPTASTASAAEQLNIPVLREFFGEHLGQRLATQGQQADLIIGNNVYAHVPNINDFTRGLKALLKPHGTITIEFPHLLKLLQYSQFDTVYHEHFSYLSLYTTNKIFQAVGLRIWDVEQLSTHGGSLRIFGCHQDDPRPPTTAVSELLNTEKEYGLQTDEVYKKFQLKADKIKNDFIAFLVEQYRSEKAVVAYGAAAKGNTLLNYAGIKPDLLPFVCDAAISKQGKFMPGSHLPILPPSILHKHKIDYVVILPWNIAIEIRKQLSNMEKQGTKFVVAVPELEVLT